MLKNGKSAGLRMALPVGSLEEGTLRLFEEANLAVARDARRHEANIENPLFSQVTFMRPQHIPRLVHCGTYDVGICGRDCVSESNVTVGELAVLSYGRGQSTGKAEVVLVTGQDNPVTMTSLVEREQVTVLSEYPNLTRKVLTAQGVLCNVEFSYGGTEAHIPKDYLYGVCLTDTGKSLKANGLRIIASLLSTQTILIVGLGWEKNRCLCDSIKTLRHLLLGALEARGQVLLKMNVSARKKASVLRMLPSLKKPTLSLLSDGVSFAVEAVVPKKDANGLMVKLAKAGAQGIIRLPIEMVIQSW